MLLLVMPPVLFVFLPPPFFGLFLKLYNKNAIVQTVLKTVPLSLHCFRNKHVKVGTIWYKQIRNIYGMIAEVVEGSIDGVFFLHNRCGSTEMCETQKLCRLIIYLHMINTYIQGEFVNGNWSDLVFFFGGSS